MSCFLILGGMFAGKTTETIRRLRKYSDGGAKVAYINHIKDTRGELFSTHNESLAKVHPGIDFFKVNNLSEVNIIGYDYIGVDEAHFFPDLNEIVRRWVLDYDKDVLVAGLNGDKDLNNIGQIHLLLPLCAPHGILILDAICHECRKEGKKMSESIAGFSYEIKHSKDQIVVGGKESYQARCLRHYKKGVESPSH